MANTEPCVYEAHPGAASAVLAPGYRARQPHQSVLHRIVREHLQSFLAEGGERSANGEGYPYYVEKELREYLGCADWSRGFCRVRCGTCGHELLLPFSCKNRGICPSCTARRMSDEAAYLVDMVLPEAPYRQWTVTFPYAVRFLMAKDYRLITAIFGIALRLIFAWQHRQAKRAGYPGAKPAAVGLVQRFGGALNSHVHAHLIVPDGVFVPGNSGDPQQTLRLLPVPPPQTADLVCLVSRLATRVTALLERRLGALEMGPDDSLGGAIGEALTGVPSRPRAPAEDDEPESRTSARCAALDGFSIHANTAVPAHDRVGLEKLCRYGMRPPFSQENLWLSETGQVQLGLKRPWPTRDGVSVLSFEPLAFLRRLAPLIPPPYAHLIRYYGLFAPNAYGRDLLPPAPVTWQGIRPTVALRGDCGPGQRSPADAPSKTPTPHGGDDHPDPPDPASSAASTSTRWPRRTVLPWHELLRRVFAVDALLCPKCLGRMTVIAYLTDPAVVHKILAHLGLPTSSPPLAPARLPAQVYLLEDESSATQHEPSRSTPDHASRAPPAPDNGERWVELDEPIETDDWGV